MTDERMAPDASPGAMKQGVRRVNNVPLYILGAVLAAFVLIMAIVMVDRAAQQNTRVAEEQRQAGNTLQLAKAIVGQQTGVIEAAYDPVPKLPPPESPTAPAPPTPQPPLLVATSDQLQPAPPNKPPVEIDEDARHIRTVKLQLFEAAVKSPIRVPIVTSHTAGTSRTTRDQALGRLTTIRQQLDAAQYTDPTAAYQARLAQIRKPSLDSGGENAPRNCYNRVRRAMATTSSRAVTALGISNAKGKIREDFSG